MKKNNLLIATLFFLGIGAGKAQITDVLSFDGTNGANPTGSFVKVGNVLYAMTQNGGTDGLGCVFKIDTDGSGYKDLLDFTQANGGTPLGSLTLVGYKLYGMTSIGGVNNFGIIFCIDTEGGGYEHLWDFDDTGSNGASPSGGLTISGYKMYGMTVGGGTNGYGCVFSIDTNGNAYKQMYAFVSGGGEPHGSLTLSHNKLYGMAYYGPHGGEGNIFSIDTGGGAYTDLHDGAPLIGEYPLGDLTLLGGKLFGMMQNGGGGGGGTIFSIDTNGNGYRNVYNFNGTTGDLPNGDLTYISGKFYGLTEMGGSSSDGVVFSVDTSGNAYNEMASFNNTNGAYPLGSLTLSGNTLFGMTSEGASAHADGDIFEIDTNNSTTSIANLFVKSDFINVYPNPNNGQFTVQINDKSAGRNMEVYNMLGEQVYSQTNIVNPQFIIDLSSQPAGVYLYRIMDETGGLIGEGRIIVQK